MRKGVLVPVAIWTAVLAAVIEFLAQKSNREGGLAVSSLPEEIPPSTRFTYEFLHIIIAVIFSIVWTWVDLDRKWAPALAGNVQGGWCEGAGFTRP